MSIEETGSSKDELIVSCFEFEATDEAIAVRTPLPIPLAVDWEPAGVHRKGARV